MANVIKLHKGLNINLKGKPAQEFFDVKQPDIYAIVPDDFHGVTPKVVVKEQEYVTAGGTLFVDKNHPEAVSYTHLRAHETGRNIVCRLLLEKKNSMPSSS